LFAKGLYFSTKFAFATTSVRQENHPIPVHGMGPAHL